MTVYNFSQTPARNATADATINWREGQAAPTLNDSARAVMAAVAKWRDDLAGTINTGGSATEVTIATNQSLTELIDGFTVRARITTTFGANPTLSVDGLDAKNITRVNGEAVPAGWIVAGSIQELTYDEADDEFRLGGNIEEFASGTSMLFGNATAPSGWTKVTTEGLGDRMLRLVTGTPSAGGSTPFSSVFTARTIAQANLPAITLSVTGTTDDPGNHTHSVPNGGNSAGVDSGPDFSAVGTDPLTSGGGGSHTHVVTGDTEVIGSGTAWDFAVQFVDVIGAIKD